MSQVNRPGHLWVEVTFLNGPGVHTLPKLDKRGNAGWRTQCQLPSHTLPHNITKADRGADSRAGVPQQLLWQRLGFPSRNIWSHVQDVLVDHGLPDATHLKHNFSLC